MVLHIHNKAIVTYTCIFKKDGSGQLADGKIKWDASGNLTIDGSVKVNATITAEQVNALTLTTTKGTIGGWSITSNSIYKNNVYFGSDGSIYNGTYWKLNKDGSGQLANGNIKWLTNGDVTITGTINAKGGTFTGELKGATGSFKSLDCLNEKGDKMGGITFGSDGKMWLSGNLYHQGGYRFYHRRYMVQVRIWSKTYEYPSNWIFCK